MIRFSYNRNMMRWQIRDEDGNTTEPEVVEAWLGDKLLFVTDTHPYTRKVDPSMGAGHGALLVDEKIEFRTQ